MLCDAAAAALEESEAALYKWTHNVEQVPVVAELMRKLRECEAALENREEILAKAKQMVDEGCDQPSPIAFAYLRKVSASKTIQIDHLERKNKDLESRAQHMQDTFRVYVDRIHVLEGALKDEMQWDMGGVPENEWKRRAGVFKNTLKVIIDTDFSHLAKADYIALICDIAQSAIDEEGDSLNPNLSSGTAL